MQNSTKRYRDKVSNILLEFLLLFVFWLVLSGRYHLKYILLGVLSAGLVTFLTNDLFHSLFTPGDAPQSNLKDSFLKLWHFLIYLPWLLSRIILANLQVAYLVLHPSMPIDPSLLQFRTLLKRKLARVILANSITLTPGTITVNLEDGRYTVHALVPASAQELLQAKMQNKIGAFFQEEKERPPSVRWSTSLKELEP